MLRSTAEIAQWGRMGGRPPALDGEALARLRSLLSEGLTQAEIAEQLGVSLATVARAIKRDGQRSPASD